MPPEFGRLMGDFTSADALYTLRCQAPGVATVTRVTHSGTGPAYTADVTFDTEGTITSFTVRPEHSWMGRARRAALRADTQATLRASRSLSRSMAVAGAV